MDVAEAEGFLDEVLLCLPILGVSLLMIGSVKALDNVVAG